MPAVGLFLSAARRGVLVRLARVGVDVDGRDQDASTSARLASSALMSRDMLAQSCSGSALARHFSAGAPAQTISSTSAVARSAMSVLRKRATGRTRGSSAPPTKPVQPTSARRGTAVTS